MSKADKVWLIGIIVWVSVACTLDLDWGPAFAIALVLCGAGYFLLRVLADAIEHGNPRWIFPATVLGGLSLFYFVMAPGFGSGVVVIGACLVLPAAIGASARKVFDRWPRWQSQLGYGYAGCFIVACGTICLWSHGLGGISVSEMLLIPFWLFTPSCCGWYLVAPREPKRGDARLAGLDELKKAGFGDER